MRKIWGYFYKSIITYKQHFYLPVFHIRTIYITDSNE